MKKEFWGYSIREVDELLGHLSEQNEALRQHSEYLEDEIKNLKKQLEELKISSASGMTKADSDAYQELKIAYTALLERMQCNENGHADKNEFENAVAEADEIRDGKKL